MTSAADDEHAAEPRAAGTSRARQLAERSAASSALISPRRASTYSSAGSTVNVVDPRQHHADAGDRAELAEAAEVGDEQRRVRDGGGRRRGERAAQRAARSRRGSAVARIVTARAAPRDSARRGSSPALMPLPIDDREQERGHHVEVTDRRPTRSRTSPTTPTRERPQDREHDAPGAVVEQQRRSRTARRSRSPTASCPRAPSRARTSTS